MFQLAVEAAGTASTYDDGNVPFPVVGIALVAAWFFIRPFFRRHSSSTTTRKVKR